MKKVLNRILQKMHNIIDWSVQYRGARWFCLVGWVIWLMWRVIVEGYLAILFAFGLGVLYLVVQFFTPLGLPDPDEDNFESQQLFQKEQEYGE